MGDDPHQPETALDSRAFAIYQMAQAARGGSAEITRCVSVALSGRQERYRQALIPEDCLFLSNHVLQHAVKPAISLQDSAARGGPFSLREP